MMGQRLLWATAICFACGGQSTSPSNPNAQFAFIVGGVTQTPLTCPSANWEFALNQDPTTVRLQNTGTTPIAYIARKSWTLGVKYEPGVATGDADELTGVLDAGATVDITTAYAGGITALLGSAGAFSTSGAMDEGTIAWPSGVTGANGAATMQLAEIEVEGSCTGAHSVW